MMKRFMSLRVKSFSGRILGSLLLVAVLIACCYYYKTAPSYNINANGIKRKDGISYPDAGQWFVEKLREPPKGYSNTSQCQLLKESTADIDTVNVFPTFEFQASWLKSKEFWDKELEDRYYKLRDDSQRPKLKVIVVPHSHNDPGWLRTFEQYFETKTQEILNNMVTKLHQYPNMTFIWSEISFLNAWWERSHPVAQKALKKLIKQGRVEITTGGWVMPDEACTHIYSLVDQFIEGHLWMKNNLEIEPKTGWSVDPFGHGPTVPYLLDKSGLDGAIIQRIHYSWKQWFAQNQVEEFHWIPGWVTDKPNLIVHNQPFDIYSIKSSCGPHPSVCLSFDFRKIPGEYQEHTAKQQMINDQNLHSRAKTLVEEYQRIGSLTPHNVVLVPLGDDFRYNFPQEFDGQYTNYMKIFQYVNENKETFNVEVGFGTPLEYFNAVKERQKLLPTLKGDFFVYSEVFSEGKPAYWSGYYTTRPYLKILARILEHNLRTSEILFTLVFNQVKQLNDRRLMSSEKRLEKCYEQIINARRNLGLFQHHDAITGTSTAAVMYDYASKMLTSLYHSQQQQELALAIAMIPDEAKHAKNVLQPDFEIEKYGKPVKKLEVTLTDRNTVVLFNSLMEHRTEVITLKTRRAKIRIFDTLRKTHPLYQITPIIHSREDGSHVISNSTYHFSFVARLPPLTAVTYVIEEYTNTSHNSVLYCNKCIQNDDQFVIKPTRSSDIQLENHVMKLIINSKTGFLKQIYRKDIKKKNTVRLEFGAYRSAQRRSGAYLFMPDVDAPEKNVLGNYRQTDVMEEDNLVLAAGPIFVELSSSYKPFLTHKLTLYVIDDYELTRGIYIQNIINFENPPKNRDTELFMRLNTDIQNGDLPEFYTDQNGFQYQKRVKVNNLGIEANYYPITTMAWLQDGETRLTLITNHAQGASAYEPGRLEVMLERRTLYDDFRGLGEGIVDNKVTLLENWIILESIGDSKPSTERSNNEKPIFETSRDEPRYIRPNIDEYFERSNKDEPHYQLPSQTADYLSRTLNYPVNTYILDTSEVGPVKIKSHHRFAQDLPSGLHLVNLRTITDDILDQFPSNSCLMILQRTGRICDKERMKPTQFTNESMFANLRINDITEMTLTGLSSRGNVSSFKDISLASMDIKTYRIRF